ncbi:MAG: outer membrane protein transport protein, partial [Methylophaga sp.]|nr:outer membrane protein transport protein [Methylophaga sp.]
MSISAGLLIATLTMPTFATNGYLPHGYGIRAQGMGGAGLALPQDTIAAASNPAGMALIGDRIDLGLSWFRPQREATISGSPLPPVNGKFDADKTENFLIPEFGYNRKITSDFSLGVSVYGHGGMNTDYDRPIPLLGNSRPGVDLAQLFVAPTIAWQITPKHSLGLAVNFAYQRFEAKGLQNFDNPAFTKHPGKVTNNGHDSSIGAGIHLGWIGQISDSVSVGAAYQSKTYMSEFDDYKGLFADDGDFDIPAHYGVGIAIKATPKLTVVADVERIFYSDVNSVGNDSVGKLLTGQQLG